MMKKGERQAQHSCQMSEFPEDFSQTRMVREHQLVRMGCANPVIISDALEITQGSAKNEQCWTL